MSSHPRSAPRLVPGPRSIALWVLCAAACASTRPPPIARPPPSMPAVHSSVAAVLAHREALGLDEDQVRSLQAIDVDLARKQRSDQQARPPKRERDSSGEGELPLPGSPPPPGRRHEGRRGASGVVGGSGKELKDPDEIWDDNDSEAFYAAEEILRPDQREPAEKVAGEYREALYDARAAKGAEPRTH